MNIEKIDLNDIGQILKIERQVFATPWTINMFVHEINSSSSLCFALKQGEKVVGYACGWVVLDEFHICNIAIDAKYQGLGLGKKLLNHLLEQAKCKGVTQFFLEVRRGDNRAVNFYKTLNFTESGIRKNYYERENEDALLMSLTLASY